MTCAEALALGRPLLLHRSLPGQEQANEAGLVAAGAALRARGARELQAALGHTAGRAGSPRRRWPRRPGACGARKRGARWPRRCSPSSGGNDRARRPLGGSGRRRPGRPTPGAAQCALPAVAWRRGPAGGRRIALTFDDGPDPVATPRLLRAPGRARRPGHVLPDRRARRAEPRRGARDQGRGSRGRATTPGATGTRGSCRRARRPGRSRRARASSSDILGDSPRLYRPPWGIVNAASLATARRLGLLDGPLVGPARGAPPARSRPPSSATSRTASTTARSWTSTTRRGFRARPSGFSPRCPASSTCWRRAATPPSRWASSSPAPRALARLSRQARRRPAAGAAALSIGRRAKFLGAPTIGTVV